MIPPADRVPLPTCIADLPPLPGSFWAVLEAGATSIEGLELTAEARLAIDAHVRLLLAWNPAINLTAIRDVESIAREHVLDSLTAVPLLRGAGVEELLDLGSGPGFPGLPLAAVVPARRTLLVESTGKKARFLSTVVDAAGMRDVVRVAATRSEALAADPRHRERWQGVVARAVTDLGELAELALPLLRVGGGLVAWKRRPFDGELARAERALRPLGGRVASVEQVHVAGLEDHVLVVVEKTAPTPREYPRDPAARRRRPLGGPLGPATVEASRAQADPSSASGSKP